MMLASEEIKRARLDKLRLAAEVKHKSAWIMPIANLVTEYYGITFIDLVSRRKPEYIAWPRQVTYYLAYRHTKRSARDIGLALGMRDHSSVLNGIKRITGRIQREPVIRAQVELLEKHISEL